MFVKNADEDLSLKSASIPLQDTVTLNTFEHKHLCLKIGKEKKNSTLIIQLKCIAHKSEIKKKHT